MTYRLGVDVGGTFTDVLLIDERTGGTYRAVPDPRSLYCQMLAALGAMGRVRDVQRLFDPLELDTSRIRALLDWSPPVSLAEGVRRAVAPK